MFRKHLVVVAIGVTCLLATTALAQGTARGKVYTKNQVEQIIKRLENNTDTFKKKVDKDLDKGIFNGMSREDRINDQVADLEQATDKLRKRFDKSDRWEDTKDEVQGVVREARDINELFNRKPVYSSVKPSWVAVKTDTNTLAGIYNIPPVR